MFGHAAINVVLGWFGVNPDMDWCQTSQFPVHVAAPMQQHAFYAKAFNALGAVSQSWSCGPADDPIGSAIVFLRRWPVIGTVAHVSRGPIWHPSITPLQARFLTERLVRALNVRGTLVASDPMRGEDPLVKSRLMPVMTPATLADLSLIEPEETRLARQHGKWRNRLRRAQQNGLTVQSMPMPTEPEHWLLQAELEQSRDKRYRGLPPSFALAWRLENGPASTRLFLAKRKGDVVAAMLFLKHGKRATYQIGWSNAAGRTANAKNLLLWDAARWFAARGVLGIDLGTLDTVNAASLARFKLGAGATANPLGATYLQAPGTRFFAACAKPWPKSRQSLRGPASSQLGEAPQQQTLSAGLLVHPRV